MENPDGRKHRGLVHVKFFTALFNAVPLQVVAGSSNSPE